MEDKLRKIIIIINEMFFLSQLTTIASILCCDSLESDNDYCEITDTECVCLCVRLRIKLK